MQKRTPKFVSIIISNYNAKEFLEKCLASLMKLSYPTYEVIVVDAGSTDGSAEIVKKKFSDVRLIETRKMGIGEAINLGIQHSKGEIIVFDLNSDDVVDKNWLSILVSALETSPEIGIVEGKRYGTTHGVLYGAGGKVNWITGNVYGIGQGKMDSEEFNFGREVDFVRVIAVKREVIRRIGLCDHAYYIYFEDTDFCIRAKKAGFKILYVPEAILWHVGGATVGKGTLRAYYYFRRNHIRFIVKNFPISTLFTALFLSLIAQMLFDVPRILPLTYYLFSIKGLKNSALRGDIRYIETFFKVLLWNFRNLRETIHARWQAKMIVNRLS